MSFVTVSEVKAALVLSLDEDRIQQAIDDAEDEALQFLNITGTSLEDVINDALSRSDSGRPQGNFRSVRRAVILLAEAYVDTLKPADRAANRKAAETLLWPYRENLGV